MHCDAEAMALSIKQLIKMLLQSGILPEMYNLRGFILPGQPIDRAEAK